MLSSYMWEEVCISFDGFLFDDDLAMHAMMVTAIPDCQEEEICYGFVGHSHARSVNYAINWYNIQL